MTAVAELMLDTNILVYAVSRTPGEADKRARSRRVIAEETFGLSAQVLQEFYWASTRKGARPLSPVEALGYIEEFETYPCVPVDAEMVKSGVELSERFRIAYWDGAILAAAHRLGAKTLFTEDLAHGQTYGSVRAVNPYLPS